MEVLIFGLVVFAVLRGRAASDRITSAVGGGSGSHGEDGSIDGLLFEDAPLLESRTRDLGDLSDTGIRHYASDARFGFLKPILEPLGKIGLVVSQFTPAAGIVNAGTMITENAIGISDAVRHEGAPVIDVLPLDEPIDGFDVITPGAIDFTVNVPPAIVALETTPAGISNAISEQLPFPALVPAEPTVDRVVPTTDAGTPNTFTNPIASATQSWIAPVELPVDRQTFTEEPFFTVADDVDVAPVAPDVPLFVVTGPIEGLPKSTDAKLIMGQGEPLPILDAPIVIQEPGRDILDLFYESEASQEPPPPDDNEPIGPEPVSDLVTSLYQPDESQTVSLGGNDIGSTDAAFDVGGGNDSIYDAMEEFRQRSFDELYALGLAEGG